MFQPICRTSTQTFIEDGWIKKKEQGSYPSFNRIKKWFNYSAQINFNYSGKTITGKIENLFESNKTFHIKAINIDSEEFQIKNIELFTATYFFQPAPVEIIYRNNLVKQIYFEKANSAPSLNRLIFFYIKQFPVTFGYAADPNQTEIVEIACKINEIKTHKNANYFYTHEGSLIKLSEICYYRSKYKIKRPYHLSESSIKEDLSQIRVLLTSGRQTFTVNWKRLNRAIPHFISLCPLNPLSKEMLEYDLSHLLNEQQLFLLLRFLNHEVELNQRNAFDLYFIASLMKMDGIRKDSEFKAIQYLIKKGTRHDIDLILQQPVLKNLLKNFGKKLINYFEFNYPVTANQLFSPIEKYFNQKLRPWKTEYPEIEYESIHEGFKKFTLFSHIKELKFNFNHFESNIKDIFRICEILGAHIEAVSLNEVEDSDVPFIISSLKEKKIKAIAFDSDIPYKHGIKQPPNQNGLTKDGIAQLVTLLETLPELEDLRFKNHQFEDEGVKLISDFIQNHPRLKKIALNTPFSEIALEQLFKSLNRSTIEILCLNAVRIGNYLNHNLPRWPELISDNSTLKALSLNNNQFNDDHIDLIIHIINHNTSLETINLSGNIDITNEGRKKLRDALQNNMTIKKLMVDNSYFNPVNLVESKKATGLFSKDTKNLRTKE